MESRINPDENPNSDDQSTRKLNDFIDYLYNIKIEKDKEFIPYYKNSNINKDESLLCSIFEIKKKNERNPNEYNYEIISTSNSFYDNGNDNIDFYSIVNKVNTSIEIKKKETKKIFLALLRQILFANSTTTFFVSDCKVLKRGK